MTDAGGGDLASIRRSYERATLARASLADDELAAPLLAVRRWLGEARDAPSEVEPTAMTLSTTEVTAAGPRPDARVVLCKGIDRGLVFYTARRSAKGLQLAATPEAAATFLWAGMQRQVRCRGRVEQVDDATSDAYFASRPRESQLGAWASTQSEVIADRAALEARAAEVATRFVDKEVPRPPRWGGYRLVPDTVELWQGRAGRLHDRLRWQRTDGGDTWNLERLQP